MISPQEIEGVDLPRTVFGSYKADKVREHLLAVAWEVRQLLLERGDTETELDRLRRELTRSKRRDELVAVVLESTHQTALEIRQEARQEAELLLKKASEHAARLRHDVERESAAQLAEVEREYAARLTEVAGLKTESAKLRAELRRFIKTLLMLVEPGDLDANMQRHEIMSDLERVVEAQRTAKPSWETPAPAAPALGMPVAEPVPQGQGNDEVATDPDRRRHGSLESDIRFRFARKQPTDGSERVA